MYSAPQQGRLRPSRLPEGGEVAPPVSPDLQREIEQVYSELAISIGVIQGDIVEVAEEITDAAEQEEVLANAYQEVAGARRSYSELRGLLRSAPREVKSLWLSRAKECQTKLQRTIDDLNELEQMASMSYHEDELTQVLEHPGGDTGMSQLRSVVLGVDSGLPDASGVQVKETITEVQSAERQSIQNEMELENKIEHAYRKFRETIDVAMTNMQIAKNAHVDGEQQSAILDLVEEVKEARILHSNVRELFSYLSTAKRRVWKPRVRAARETLQSLILSLQSLDSEAAKNRSVAPGRSVRFHGIDESSTRTVPSRTSEDQVEEMKILLTDIEDALEDLNDCEGDEKETWIEELDKGLQHAWSIHLRLVEQKHDKSIQNELEDRLKSISEHFELLRVGESSGHLGRDISASQIYREIELGIARMRERVQEAKSMDTRSSRQRVIEEVEEIGASVTSLYASLADQVKGMGKDARMTWASRFRLDREALNTINRELRDIRDVPLQPVGHVGVPQVEMRPSAVIPEPLLAEDSGEIDSAIYGHQKAQLKKILEDLRWTIDALREDFKMLVKVQLDGKEAHIGRIDERMDEALKLFSNLKVEVRLLPQSVRSRWISVLLHFKRAISNLSQRYVVVRETSKQSRGRRLQTLDIARVDENFQSQRRLFQEGELDYSLDQLDVDLGLLAGAMTKNMGLISQVMNVDLKEGIFDDLRERLDLARLIYEIYREKVRALPDLEYDKWIESAKRRQGEMKRVIRTFRGVASDVDSKSRFAKYMDSESSVEFRDADLENVLNQQRAELEMLYQMKDTVYRQEEIIQAFHKVSRTAVLLDLMLGALGRLPIEERVRWFRRTEYQQRRVSALHSFAIVRLQIPIQPYEERDLGFLKVSSK